MHEYNPTVRVRGDDWASAGFYQIPEAAFVQVRHVPDDAEAVALPHQRLTQRRESFSGILFRAAGKRVSFIPGQPDHARAEAHKDFQQNRIVAQRHAALQPEDQRSPPAVDGTAQLRTRGDDGEFLRALRDRTLQTRVADERAA